MCCGQLTVYRGIGNDNGVITMSKTVIPDLDKVLAGSEFEDKKANYKKFFAQAKIVTVLDLENCPRYAGSNLCGHSTYGFIAYVREYTLNPPPEDTKPVEEEAPKKKRKYTKKKVELVIPITDDAEEGVDSDVSIGEDAHSEK